MIIIPESEELLLQSNDEFKFQEHQEINDCKLYISGSSRHSPPAVTQSPVDTSLQTEEMSTPNATLDAEFEPSSLSLAERLAFFSNLCDNSGSGGGRFRSRTSSYSRSPPLDRTTPRSSTTASSASVTPTPMDYSPIPHEKEPTSLTLESIIEPEEQEQEREQEREQKQEQERRQVRKQEQEQERELEEQVELRKNDQETAQHNGFHGLSRSATEPTPLKDNTTPLRTVRVRTVGKLILPDTFLGDRNNNNNNTIKSTSWNTCIAKLQTLDAVNLSVTMRTIGKVKSPFIEKQKQEKNSSLSNGTSDSGSDSGKENYAFNQQEQQQQQLILPEDQGAPQKVSEMRRKITRLVQQNQPQPVNRRHTTEITTSVSLASSAKPANVDDRFAKYFGVKESFNTTTTLLKTNSLPAQNPSQPQVEATNAHVRLPSITVMTKRRELLKRTRPVSLDHYSSGSVSPTSHMPSPKRSDRMSRRKSTIASFEDIEVTPDELYKAGQDFKRLCGEILG